MIRHVYSFRIIQTLQQFAFGILLRWDAAKLAINVAVAACGLARYIQLKLGLSNSVSNSPAWKPCLR